MQARKTGLKLSSTHPVAEWQGDVSPEVTGGILVTFGLALLAFIANRDLGTVGEWWE